MRTVLIDKFIVPEESVAAFLEAARQSTWFLKTLPEFVEGFIYEETSGDSRTNVITSAVWESEQAFENAKEAASAEFQKVDSIQERS